MSHENSLGNYPGGFPVEQHATQQTGGFEAMLNGPLAERARQIGRGVGREALIGAAEGSGLVKFDDEGNMKVRKVKAAMAVVRPAHTARKAAMGAVNGARTAGMQEARNQGQALRSEAIQSATNAVMGGFNQAPAIAPFGSNPNDAGGFPPPTPNTVPFGGGFPAPTPNSNPFGGPEGNPFAPPSANYGGFPPANSDPFAGNGFPPPPTLPPSGFGNGGGFPPAH